MCQRDVIRAAFGSASAEIINTQVWKLTFDESLSAGELIEIDWLSRAAIQL